MRISTGRSEVLLVSARVSMRDWGVFEVSLVGMRVFDCLCGSLRV